ncbi:MAG TPA: porin, partial [Xanthobacteraceae bacterium]
GAQAADLPVKAKPVEYVRVCSLYGAGFWYVPGTDTCLKIGSYVREQVEWNAGNGGVPIGLGATDAAAAGRFTRTDTSQLSMRTRAAITVDLRTQTEYGTLRSYLEGGFQTSANNGSAPGNDAVYFDRGFIQFAGLTAGRIRSYFDINSMAPYSYLNTRVSGDTGALGLWGIAYTAQFGNGLSATLSFEDGGSTSQGNNLGQNSARGHGVVNLAAPGQFGLGTESYDNEGWKFPDVVGALRIDQAWGYAQIAAALHDASGGYYTTPSAATDACGVNAFCQTLGHPGDALGWAVTGGFTLNDVLGMKGDQFGMQAVYSQGAAGYATRATGPFQIYSAGQSAGFGWVTDGVFTNIGGNSDVELTTVWGINGFYQHFWNPKWRTSIHGGYEEVDYSGTAAQMICGAGGVGGFVATPAGVALTNVTNCNPDFSWWELGSRTQWNPHPDLDIGVDVVWEHLNTAFRGTATLATNGARPAGSYNIDDQDTVSVYFRVQRNFLP